MSEKRKAVFVGVGENTSDHIKSIPPCFKDAREIADALEFSFYSDQQPKVPNFTNPVRLYSEDDPEKIPNKANVLKAAQELFAPAENPPEITLFYYSGHASPERKSKPGQLLLQDFGDGQSGLPIEYLIQLAEKSNAGHKVIILDCCFSGQAQESLLLENYAHLPPELTLFAASNSDEPALGNEDKGSYFTDAIVMGLEGMAADIMGNITLHSLFKHTFSLFEPWDQRPVFRSHSSSIPMIKMVEPKISSADQKELVRFFPTEKSMFKLIRDYHENDSTRYDFRKLQQFNRARLIRPEKEDHMWWASQNEDNCQLTQYGKYVLRTIKRRNRNFH